MEEEKKAINEELIRMKEEMEQINTKLSMLKQELETTKDTCLQLEVEAKSAKGELDQKSREYELQVNDLVNKVTELEASSDSKCNKWNIEKDQLQKTVDFQFSSLQVYLQIWLSQALTSFCYQVLKIFPKFDCPKNTENKIVLAIHNGRRLEREGNVHGRMLPIR